jgi:hypothetical protein
VLDDEKINMDLIHELLQSYEDMLSCAVLRCESDMLPFPCIKKN